MPDREWMNKKFPWLAFGVESVDSHDREPVREWEPKVGERMEFRLMGGEWHVGKILKIHPSGVLYVESEDGSLGANMSREKFQFRKLTLLGRLHG